MRPLRSSAFDDAMPLDGRGRRTPQTMLLLDERDQFLRAAAAHFPGLSHREIARRLHVALSRYRDGRWRRDQSELTCPSQHAGKLTATLWMLLRVKDYVPSERTIRAALAGMGREP
jgi:hypothetical protein